jgi:hypothetical protein
LKKNWNLALEIFPFFLFCDAVRLAIIQKRMKEILAIDHNESRKFEESENLKNPFIFWLPPGVCCRNLAIFFENKILQIRFIFSQKYFVCPQIIFFRSNMRKLATKEKTL